MSAQTEVKERPILFNAAMVNAILAGRKTQTRRVIPYSYLLIGDDAGYPDYGFVDTNGREVCAYSKCPYGKPGDRLWVREAHRACDHFEIGTCVEYRADNVVIKPEWPDTQTGWKWEQDANATDWESWRPSIHMPRWASRISLDVTRVRVQRLRDISEEDAQAEGCPGVAFGRGSCGDEGVLPTDQFIPLWDSINAKRGFGWDTNPWVWVIEFRAIKP